MNEQIQKIAEQAKFMAEEDINRQISYNTELKAFAEKFAELILKECIELNRQELAFNAFERMLNRYKEHFGVEE